MTRREMIAAAAGVVLLSAEELRGQESWITIAEPGWNKNQRAYTEEALQAMLEGARTAMVAEGDIWPEEYSLSLVRGRVRSARRGSNGEVQVQIEWYKRPEAPGYITPTGLGTFEEKAPGWNWIMNFKLTCLCYVPESAFHGATRV